MECRQRLVGLVAALALPLVMAGCNSSSDGDSGGDAGSGGEAGDPVDVQSAVTLASRNHWLHWSTRPFEHALNATAFGHVSAEPIRWFSMRTLIAQGLDMIPEGGPARPDCAAGSVDFTETDAGLTAYYDQCRIGVDYDLPPGVSPPPIVRDQVWEGRQTFLRELGHPDWERVYEVEYDAMTYSSAGESHPFRPLNGAVNLYYRDINDVMLQGALSTGHPVGGTAHLMFHDYTSLDVRWEPDGFEGAKTSGRMEVTVSIAPASVMEQLQGQQAGAYGDWTVETQEPIRYEETITQDLRPYAGKVHFTAEDGNTIVYEFDPSGLFMDGVFITWEQYDRIQNDQEFREAFLEQNYPGSWPW